MFTAIFVAFVIVISEMLDDKIKPFPGYFVNLKRFTRVETRTYESSLYF